MGMIAGIITMFIVFVIELILLAKGKVLKDYKEKKNVAALLLFYIIPGVSGILVSLLVNMIMGK